MLLLQDAAHNYQEPYRIMTTNLFHRMTRPINVTRESLPAEDEIHAAQLQQLMMAEVLATSPDVLSDTIPSYLDNSRRFGVTAAVALFPQWIFATNYNAYLTLPLDELKCFIANCEAMFAGEKFHYDDGCAIDAGAGTADSPKQLLAICVVFNHYQCENFSPEEIARFHAAGLLLDDEQRDMLADLADAA